MRIGSGSTIWRSPASQQPWMMVISARLVGPEDGHVIAGHEPRACSAAPTARASSWICAHETTSTRWDRRADERSDRLCRRSARPVGAIGATSMTIGVD